MGHHISISIFNVLQQLTADKIAVFQNNMCCLSREYLCPVLSRLKKVYLSNISRLFGQNVYLASQLSSINLRMHFKELSDTLREIFVYSSNLGLIYRSN